jgi:hypothetical protein
VPTNTLQVRVEALKIIARNALRMNLISPRLSETARKQSQIDEVNKYVNDLNHQVKVQTYEISKLDIDHPDYADKKANKEKKITEINTTIKEQNELVTNLQKDIEEQNKAIAMIESGETKVSLEDLNTLVERLVREDAFKQVNA